MARALFPTVLTPAQFTVANNNTMLSLALGMTTIVLCTTTQSLSFNGIIASSGNVDGMVVTIQQINTGSFNFSFAHDSGSPASGGFYNPGSAVVTTGTAFGAATFRYHGTSARWINIGKV